MGNEMTINKRWQLGGPNGFVGGGLQPSENSLSSSRPYDRSTPSSPCQRHNNLAVPQTDVFVTSSDFLTSSPGPPRHDNAQWISKGGTMTSDSESGISSKTSSMLEDSSSACYMTPPSSPVLSSRDTPPRRNQPPPKPPRRNKPNNAAGQSDSMSPYSSVRSATLASPELSMLDISSTLDRSSLLRHNSSSDDVTTGSRNHSALLIRDKIFQVLVQTREFMFYEINPESIMAYLHLHGVISGEQKKALLCSTSREAMCELLLDIITAAGQEEFALFCSALRVVEKQDYLADLLMVLDKLIDTVTTAHGNHSNANSLDSLGGAQDNFAFMGSSLSMNQTDSFFSGSRTTRSCSSCLCDNNNPPSLDDSFQDCGSFDIEIFYYNSETGEMKAICDVANIKKKGKTKHIANKDECFLEKMDRENAEKYIPVISLSLYNQCLYKSGIDTLATILEDHTCIRELSLCKNHMDDKAMKRLGEALQKNNGLVKLDIRLNTIGEEGAKHLAYGIKHNKSLQTINVTSTDLIGPSSNVLLEGLMRHSYLTDLNVGFNDLGYEGCKGIATMLITNRSIQKLRMRDNGIDSYGAKVVFKAMKRNSHLLYLDMSSNAIGSEESMAVLAEVLVHNRTLREINLEKCGLLAAGCTKLARALKTNTTLRVLELSMNAVGDSGVVALGLGLQYNRALQQLSLNMCQVGNRGFRQLLRTLRQSAGALVTLKLCYNQIGVQETLQSASPDITDDTIDEETCSDIFDTISLTPSMLSINSCTSTGTLLKNGIYGGVNCSPSPDIDDSDIITPIDDAITPTSVYNMFTPPLSKTDNSHKSDTVSLAESMTPTVEELYDELCQVLQVNKNLKVLLWGNKLDEPGTITCYPAFSS